MEKKNNKRNNVLTDLHCHILPGIDDGASNIDVSKAILEEEKKQGIKQIIFTPHFYPDKKSLNDFLKDRNKSAASIVPILQEGGFTCGLGGEVHMSEELLHLDLRQLAYTDTDYILLEWPFSSMPIYGKDIVKKCLDCGLTPIFAHIERYDYFFRDLKRVQDYIDMGCVMQMNAKTVILSETARKVISQGYVHILSTDTHNMDKRPPRLLEALQVLDEDTQDLLIENATRVFNNHPVKNLPVKKKSSFWGSLF